jgi:hypothetical protein
MYYYVNTQKVNIPKSVTPKSCRTNPITPLCSILENLTAQGLAALRFTVTAPEPESAVLTGRTVSHYRVLEVIGGGMAWSTAPKT